MREPPSVRIFLFSIVKELSLKIRINDTAVQRAFSTSTLAFPVKREADHVGSDFDITPTKKVKVEKKSNSKASPMKWTVEDAKLIKKLREEDGLGWKFCSSPVSQLITEKLRSSSQALKWVQLGKLTIRE